MLTGRIIFFETDTQLANNPVNTSGSSKYYMCSVLMLTEDSLKNIVQQPHGDPGDWPGQGWRAQ